MSVKNIYIHLKVNDLAGETGRLTLEELRASVERLAEKNLLEITSASTAIDDGKSYLCDSWKGPT